MNTHISLILLLGAVAASPAWAADQANAGDAQAQAARLMTAQASMPLPLRKVAGETGAGDNGKRVSAQSQAAGLLQASAMASSPTSAVASDAMPTAKATGARAHQGRVRGDAQAQAQRFLLGEGSRAEKAGEVNVLAASH